MTSIFVLTHISECPGDPNGPISSERYFVSEEAGKRAFEVLKKELSEDDMIVLREHKPDATGEFVWSRDVERAPADEDETLDEIDLFNDQMDGDHESALASAGFGTDEDYGYFGDDEG